MSTYLVSVAYPPFFMSTLLQGEFKELDARDIYRIISQRVFPAIKNMKDGKLPDFDETGELILPSGESDESKTAFSKYMSDAAFLIPTPQVLQKIITGLDELYENDISDLDMQGDVYEYMLDKLSTAGQNGQFRTPKHIREMMVNLIGPTPDDVICEAKHSDLIQAHEAETSLKVA